MNIRRALKIVVAAFLLGLGQLKGQSTVQTYYYSGALSGRTDVGLNPGPGYVGSFGILFGTINETLSYDSSAQTLEEAGSITFSPASGTFVMQTLGLPSQVVGSATLTVGNNSVFSFDTIFTSAGSPGVLETGDFLIPVTGSGVYNGQSFTGSWDIQLPLITDVITASPTSLTFTQRTGDGQPTFSVGGEVVLPGLGLTDGAGGDDSINYSWNQSSAVAMAVPEPGTIILGVMLLPLGARALRMKRRRKAAPEQARVTRKTLGEA